MTGRSQEELPNIIFVQLESYFDVAEAEFFTTSKDASPNLRAMYENYRSQSYQDDHNLNSIEIIPDQRKPVCSHLQILRVKRRHTHHQHITVGHSM